MKTNQLIAALSILLLGNVLCAMQEKSAKKRKKSTCTITYEKEIISGQYTPFKCIDVPVRLPKNGEIIFLDTDLYEYEIKHIVWGIRRLYASLQKDYKTIDRTKHIDVTHLEKAIACNLDVSTNMDVFKNLIGAFISEKKLTIMPKIDGGSFFWLKIAENYKIAVPPIGDNQNFHLSCFCKDKNAVLDFVRSLLAPDETINYVTFYNAVIDDLKNLYENDAQLLFDIKKRGPLRVKHLELGTTLSGYGSH